MELDLLNAQKRPKIEPLQTAEDYEASKYTLHPSFWQQRMQAVTKKCNFSGKDKKTCQKC